MGYCKRYQERGYSDYKVKSELTGNCQRDKARGICDCVGICLALAGLRDVCTVSKADC